MNGLDGSEYFGVGAVVRQLMSRCDKQLLAEQDQQGKYARESSHVLVCKHLWIYVRTYVLSVITVASVIIVI